ncbi:MAG: hypothetical protein AAF702_23080 [Chloroflexota bacterium]
MNDLHNFLIRMAVDSNMSTMFEENSEKIMKEEGLSEIDKKSLRRGDKSAMEAVVISELETHELVTVMGNCFGSDPGPDPDIDPDPFPEEDDDDDDDDDDGDGDDTN